MPITILKPQPAPQRPQVAEAAESDVDMDSDSSDDVDMGGVTLTGGSRRRGIETSEDDGLADEILTPGTVITSNPQWMRYVSTPNPSEMKQH